MIEEYGDDQEAITRETMKHVEELRMDERRVGPEFDTFVQANEGKV